MGSFLSERHVLHERELLADVAKARNAGTRKLQRAVRRYLTSHDAKRVALHRAYRKLYWRQRPPKSALAKLVSQLDAYAGTDEKVLVHAKRKDSNPLDTRVLMEFGIENKALQCLVLRVLGELVDLDPRQYLLKGGVPAAITAVTTAMEQGHVWACEIDISDFYPSLDVGRLGNELPLPREVREKVLTSLYLNLTPGNIWYTLGPGTPTIPSSHVGHASFERWEIFSVLETLVKARRGIPQGSIASQLVAEILLAPVFKQMPPVGVIVGYADNVLLLAKNQADVMLMTQTLRSALIKHPAGPLWPTPSDFNPGEPILFLGHQLKLGDGKVHIEPSPGNRQKFHDKVSRTLKRICKTKPCARRNRLKTELVEWVTGWTNAFKLWKKAANQRAYWTKIIEKA
jgi:hypothetical protein